MSYTKRTLRELNVMDDFLMNAIASDEEVGPLFFKAVLPVLLQREIGEISVIAQKMIPAARPELHGIRLDVEVREPLSPSDPKAPAMNIYDVEPHLQKERSLPKHNRFYQAKIDGRLAPSGDKALTDLPNLYVLTITPYDPFHYGYMVYTVQNRCREVPELSYDDGIQFLYFNPVGTKGGSPKIQDMLRYFQDSREENATNDVLREIHHYVEKVKRDPEKEGEYMTLGEYIDMHAKEDAREMAEEMARDMAGEMAEEMAKGIAKGMARDMAGDMACDILKNHILNILSKRGEVSAALRLRLDQEKNPEIIEKWLDLSIEASSVGEFETKIGNGE